MTAIVGFLLFGVAAVSAILLGAFLRVWLTLVFAGPYGAMTALKRLEERCCDRLR